MFIISPDSLLFLLSPGSCSTLLLSPFHPVLKLNWLFIFPEAHPFLLVSLKLFFFFPLCLIACFYFLCLLFFFFSHEWEMRKLGKKCVKYMWRPGGGTVPTPAVLASNCVRSSPKDQEVVINISAFRRLNTKDYQKMSAWETLRLL